MSDLFWGCPWVVGKTKKGKKTVDLHCNKLVDSGKQFCPKHLLFEEDAALESVRRMEQNAAVKQHRQRVAVALAESPLRAENTAFDAARKSRNPMMEQGRR